MKRITISLDDDLYRVAKAYAISEDISLSKAVGRLLRRAVEEPKASAVGEDGGAYQYRDSTTGLLVTRVGRTITMEEVQEAIDDDDLRHLELIRNRGDDTPA